MKAKVKRSITDRKKQANDARSKSRSAKKKPVGARGGKPAGGGRKRVGSSRKPTDTEKRNVRRDRNGHILSGSGSNGGGRPIGSVAGARVDELKASISRVELERLKVRGGKLKPRDKWLDHQIKKSYEDTSLAIAILARLYPALKAIEQVSFPVDSMEQQEAEEIRKELQERCKTKVGK